MNKAIEHMNKLGYYLTENKIRQFCTCEVARFLFRYAADHNLMYYLNNPTLAKFEKFCFTEVYKAYERLIRLYNQAVNDQDLPIAFLLPEHLNTKLMKDEHDNGFTFGFGGMLIVTLKDLEENKEKAERNFLADCFYPVVLNSYIPTISLQYICDFIIQLLKDSFNRDGIGDCYVVTDILCPDPIDWTEEQKTGLKKFVKENRLRKNINPYRPEIKPNGWTEDMIKFLILHSRKLIMLMLKFRRMNLKNC